VSPWIILNAMTLRAAAPRRHAMAGPCFRLRLHGHSSSYHWRLHRMLALYVLGVLAFWDHGLGRGAGLSRHWIGPIFLFSTVMVYAGIGVYARTSDPEDYYAGRRIPPIYNGMAAAADWMSAASFISLSGALYLQGFSGPGAARRPGLCAGLDGRLLPGGHADCPHLRAMRLYTVPDFFQVRFGGRWPRIWRRWPLCLLVHLCGGADLWRGPDCVALTGVQFEIGIMLGLGGVLLCSFWAACGPSPGPRWRSMW
jgi:cation/acetate symporter